MKDRIFVIGASHGGIEALSQLIRQLPADFPAPVFIVQHIDASSPGMLPKILGRAGRLPAVHARNTEIFEKSRIYVAPADQHMLVQRGYIRLSQGPRENHTRPAIDPLFRSAAIAYGPAVVGVVLTGHLDDGTAGLMAIKDRGGIAVVQEPSEAAAPSMPRSAQANVCIDHCCKLAEMGDLLVTLAYDDLGPPEPGAHDKLIGIETRIAEGIPEAADWAALEALTVPSGLNCPECGSALLELRDERLLRFRCRAGHAFSAQSLFALQAESTENQLAALFGALSEEVKLGRRLLDSPIVRDAQTLAALKAQIGKAERAAAQVWHWMCNGPASNEALVYNGSGAPHANERE
jgi:two-component system chemotaxis response regulator CheB